MRSSTDVNLGVDFERARTPAAAHARASTPTLVDARRQLQSQMPLDTDDAEAADAVALRAVEDALSRQVATKRC